MTELEVKSETASKSENDWQLLVPQEKRRKKKSGASRGRSCVKLTEECVRVDKKERRTVFQFQPFSHSPFLECSDGDNGETSRRA